LAKMVKTAVDYNDGPIAFRYPRGSGIGIEFPTKIDKIPIGKGRTIVKGNEVLIISFGSILKECMAAAESLNTLNIHPTVIDARFAKPLDIDLLKNNIKSHKYILTVEEGSIGGFSAQVTKLIQDLGLYKNLVYKNLMMPDKFIDHDTQANQLIEAGLDSKNIVKNIQEMIDDD